MNLNFKLEDKIIVKDDGNLKGILEIEGYSLKGVKYKNYIIESYDEALNCDADISVDCKKCKDYNDCICRDMVFVASGPYDEPMRFEVMPSYTRLESFYNKDNNVLILFSKEQEIVYEGDEFREGKDLVIKFTEKDGYNYITNLIKNHKDIIVLWDHNSIFSSWVYVYYDTNPKEYVGVDLLKLKDGLDDIVKNSRVYGKYLSISNEGVKVIDL